MFCDSSIDIITECFIQLTYSTDFLLFLGIHNCVFFLVPTSFASRIVLHNDKQFSRSIYSSSILFNDKTPEQSTEAATSEPKPCKFK